jgi:hypothetical protein
MPERITAWEAYLTGRFDLPPGYTLERGTDELVLPWATGWGRRVKVAFRILTVVFWLSAVVVGLE